MLKSSSTPQTNFISDPSITPHEVATLAGHSNFVHALTVLPDGRLASGSSDNTIKLWEVLSGRCMATLEGHSNTVIALTVLPDGRLASGSGDKTIKLWEVLSGRCMATLAGHSNWVYALTVLPDGRLASGSSDKTIKLWEVLSGRCMATLEGHRESVYALTVLPDGRLASGSGDKTIKLWEVLSGRCMATLEGHSDWVNALTVLPDGRLASGSEDNTIKLWEVSSGTCVATLEGHSHYVMALTVLPDGRLASGSEDKTIKLWEVSSGTCVATLEGHSHYVMALTVLPDGRLASGSRDNTIKLWDVGLRPRQALGGAATLPQGKGGVEASPAKGASKSTEADNIQQAERERQAQLAREKEAELQRIRQVIESCQALRKTWSTATKEALCHQYAQWIERDPKLADIYIERSAYRRYLAEQLQEDGALVEKIAWYEQSLKDLEQGLSIWPDNQQAKLDQQCLQALLPPLREEQAKYQVCQALRQRWSSDKPKSIITAYEQLTQDHPDDSRYHRELAEYYVFFAEKASVNTQKINFYKKALSGFNSAMESDAFDEIAAQRFEAVSQQLAALSTASPHTSHEKAPLPATPPSPAVMPPAVPSPGATTQSDQEAEDRFDMGGLGQSLESLLIAGKDVQLGLELGRGSFGIVYAGTYAHQPVAVKTYYGTRLPEKEAAEMRHELSMMAQLRSKYLVQLWGLVQAPNRSPMIVMEYGANGSLYQFLHNHQAITWGLRLRIAEELARGLGYLHHKKIVHRDIKSLNVVLDEDFHAKWCDFGLAVLKLHTATTTKQDMGGSPVGTLRWMAPELFSRKTSSPSTASDIWALGMVFFELASREVPFKDAQNQGQIQTWIMSGEGEDVPELCQQQVPGFGQLMQRCWLERSARPSAGELVDHLAQLNHHFVEPTDTQKADLTSGYMDFSR